MSLNYLDTEDGILAGGLRNLKLGPLATETYVLTAQSGDTATLSSNTANPDSWWEMFVDVNDGGAEIVCGCVNTVDFTDVETLYIDWECTSGSYVRANFAAATTKSDIDDDGIDNNNVTYSIQKSSGFSRQTDSITIGGDATSYYIGGGIQTSTSASESNTVKIYDIWGEDSDGERIFGLAIPNGLSGSA